MVPYSDSLLGTIKCGDQLFLFLLGTISYGSLLQFLVGNHKLWFPTPISCWEPKAVASNSDLLLGTISYGSLL